jgi:vacuolar-type H+-ATPase subunit H
VRRKDHLEPTKSSATDTAERLASIVDAAERAAVAVIDDAEEQARLHLKEAQEAADRIVADRLESLAELIDSLVGRAEAIKSQADQLHSALAEARQGLDIAPAAADRGRPERPSRSPHLSAVAPVEETAAAEPLESGPASRGTSAGARLLATQMAVSGSSREEIEARLRSGFEIEDTASILDAILGPED